MEKTEHDRKQAGKGKWGDTLRKGLEGAGSLVKRGLETGGKLAGDAARGIGKLAGDTARGMGRGLERMDKARTHRYASQTKDRTKEGEHKRGMERDAQTQKHERGMTGARGVHSSYSPQENNPELGIMSEHLKVDQSGENDHWQNLMTEVVSNKRDSIMNEAKKKSIRKRGS
jgi:hypothetical protein